MGSGPDTIEQKVEPWAASQPYIKDIMGRASQAYARGGEYFPDQTFAGLNPLQMQGVEQQYNYSQGLLPRQISNAQNAWQYAMASPDAANNPYVQNMMAANERSVMDNLTRKALPSAGDSAVQAGQYGSSAHGVLQRNAMKDAATALSDANAGTLMNAYNTGMQAQSNALGQSQGMLGLGYMPGQMASTAGGLLSSEAGKYIGESMDRYNFNEGVGWDLLNKYAGIINPTTQSYSSQTAPNPNQSNAFANVLGAAGTILPLIPGFSDERLKENIEPVTGALDKILQLRGVEWDWKADGHSAGVVAQEVEKVIREAVHDDISGFKKVDYGLLLALSLEAIRELKEMH